MLRSGSTSKTLSVLLEKAAALCKRICLPVQGVSAEELLVEAKDALLRAAEDFDPKKGTRLTTYSWFGVMHRLTKVRALASSRTARFLSVYISLSI